MDKSFCTNVKKEYGKKTTNPIVHPGIENMSMNLKNIYYYPRVFVCTFCKKEFSSIGSVFSHIRNDYEFVHKSK